MDSGNMFLHPLTFLCGGAFCFRPVLLFYNQPVRSGVNLVRLRAFEQIERVDFHIDEFREVKRLGLFDIFFDPENNNTVFHLFAGHYVLHNLRWGCEMMNFSDEVFF